jgi:hypothetical protein
MCRSPEIWGEDILDPHPVCLSETYGIVNDDDLLEVSLGRAMPSRALSCHAAWDKTPRTTTVTEPVVTCAARAEPKRGPLETTAHVSGCMVATVVPALGSPPPEAAAAPPASCCWAYPQPVCGPVCLCHTAALPGRRGGLSARAASVVGRGNGTKRVAAVQPAGNQTTGKRPKRAEGAGPGRATRCARPAPTSDV